MKGLLILVIVVCFASASCNLGPELKPQQVEAAMSKFIKQDNPAGAFSVTGTEKVSDRMRSVKFTFTDFAYKDEEGFKSVPSGEGTASIMYKDDKWILDSVSIMENGAFREFTPNIEVN